MPRRKGYDVNERTVVIQVIEKKKGQRKPVTREMRFTQKDSDTMTSSSPDVLAFAERLFKKSDTHHRVIEHRRDRK